MTNRQAALIAAAACLADSFGVPVTAERFLEWLEVGEIAEVHALSAKLEAVRSYADERGLVDLLQLLEG
jgi:hypothetical protein